MKIQSPAAPRNPLSWLVAAVLFTALFIVGMIGVINNLHDGFESVERTNHECSLLDKNIVYLDEVLTMSARMAAATGDLKWETRYRKFEPALDKTIRQARAMIAASSVSEQMAVTDSANVRLVEMENRAFAAVRRGDLDGARQALFSPEYEAQKAIYARGLNEWRKGLDGQMRISADLMRNKVMVRVGTAIVLLPFWLIAWMIILRNLNQWRRLVTESNETLDRWVSDQTKVLTSANTALNSSLRQLEAATAQTRQSEEKYRLLFERSNDAMMIFCETSFFDCNPAALRVFGCASRDEFIGKHPGEMSPPHQPDGRSSREAADERIATAFREGHAFFPWTHQRMNGEVFDADVLLTPFELDGRPVFQATVRDISRMKRLEAKLFQVQKMETIGTLAGGIAHDLNNVLTAIMSNISMIHEDLGVKHPVAPLVEEIEHLVERSAILTRQLLAFSRRQVLQPIKTDLNDVVAGVIGLLYRELGERIHLEIEKAPERVLAEVDVMQMEQVLLNICANARDAMPDGGRLTIAVRRLELKESLVDDNSEVPPGHYAVLEISDTGCGMNAAVRRRAFEPFFTTKETGKGTGLGLSMAYGIVKQHHGDILIFSEPDQGTACKIFLPACFETPTLPAVVAPLAAAAGGHETILVAEDEPAVARGVRRTLERFGYRVILARDGQEAVEVFAREQERIDLVLMDAIMPRMGGKEATARIVAGKPGQKLLFTSGYPADKGAVDDSFMLPASIHFIQKPYTAADLASAVRKALDA